MPELPTMTMRTTKIRHPFNDVTEMSDISMNYTTTHNLRTDEEMIFE